MENSTPKDGGVIAPITLAGFFNDDSSDDENETKEFVQIYEEQKLCIGSMNLKIQQMAWHMANANIVWPGTFTLADFIVDHLDYYSSGKIIELGSATGALAVFLCSPPRNFDVITSDIDDGGIVAENIRHNFILNGNDIITIKYQ